jgi:hypothetical protein
MRRIKMKKRNKVDFDVIPTCDITQSGFYLGYGGSFRIHKRVNDCDTFYESDVIAPAHVYYIEWRRHTGDLGFNPFHGQRIHCSIINPPTHVLFLGE